MRQWMNTKLPINPDKIPEIHSNLHFWSEVIIDASYSTAKQKSRANRKQEDNRIWGLVQLFLADAVGVCVTYRYTIPAVLPVALS